MLAKGPATVDYGASSEYDDDDADDDDKRERRDVRDR